MDDSISTLQELRWSFVASLLHSVHGGIFIFISVKLYIYISMIFFFSLIPMRNSNVQNRYYFSIAILGKWVTALLASCWVSASTIDGTLLIVILRLCCCWMLWISSIMLPYIQCQCSWLCPIAESPCCWPIWPSCYIPYHMFYKWAKFHIQQLLVLLIWDLLSLCCVLLSLLDFLRSFKCYSSLATFQLPCWFYMN